jgi:transcriptional regulator with XRE-family HTH domain
LDRTYVSAVETGRRNITIGSLSKIIISLGLTDKLFLQELLNQMDSLERNADER